MTRPVHGSADESMLNVSVGHQAQVTQQPLTYLFTTCLPHEFVCETGTAKHAQQQKHYSRLRTQILMDRLMSAKAFCSAPAAALLDAATLAS